MTAEQDRAANPGVSAWVGASAGTGKTHMLTNRVLRLLLADARPQGILCLTFTKAAAAEMANRVNANLAEWATLPEDKLYQTLDRLEGVPPSRPRIAKARRLFAEVLDVPGGLRIETIHAFCQSLMSRFPLETGVAPHSQVLDDHSAGELMREATASVLVEAQSGRNEALGEALDFVSAHITDMKFTELLGMLSGRPGALDDTNDHGAIFRLLDLDPGASEQVIVAAACEDAAFAAGAMRAAAQALALGTRTDQERAGKIAYWLQASPAERAIGIHAYLGAFLTNASNGASKIRERLATKAVGASSPAAIDALEREALRVLDLANRIRAARAAHASRALATLGRALTRTYQRLKRQRAVLDYDDLIAKARTLVTASGNAPWVLYKLDEGLDHILVDEAQDTNPDQWAVIAALATEFFVAGGARDEINRTLFAVGDAKQSIYSFQRAEPAQFEAMRQVFHRRVTQAEKTFHHGALTLSFRSTEAVLKLVDTVFEKDEAKVGLVFHEQEARIAHEAHRKAVPGLVELWPAEVPQEVEAPENWEPPVARRELKPADVRLAERIARQISRWLSGGEILESKNRPVRPDDVLILVRRRNDFFTAVVRALKRAGVPVAGVDRMVLTEQLAVMDMLALGAFALMPEDDLTLAVVLKSPLVGLSEDDLFALAHGRDGRLWHALSARRSEPAFAEAFAFLDGCLARADRVPPYEFFAQVLDTGRRQAMLARLGPDALDPLDEFLALAIDYERAHPPSLQGFIHWVEAAQTEVKRELEQGKGEVRVMTVHGAKGLQAPIVFLPDTCGIPNEGRDIYWLDDEPGPPVLAWPMRRENAVGPIGAAKQAVKLKRDEEYNRQLYVALTRAGDRLYVCGYETQRGRAANCWYDLVQDAFDRLGVEPSEDADGSMIRRFRMGGDKVEADRPAAAGALALAAPGWLRAEPPIEPAPVRPLAPSRPALPEMPVRSPMEADNRERFLRGTLLHRLLQWLPDMAAGARREAALRFLRQPGHALAEDVALRWTDEVMAVLEEPACAALFGPGSAAEVPVTGLVGTAAISGQIDRLAVTADEVVIVDYKTNRPPPARAEDVPSIYLAQMAAYRGLLRRIYPDRPVRCALLWTDGPSLMTLPDALLDPHGEVSPAV